MWDEQHTRKPALSLRLSALLRLRATQRAQARLLFQDPPRTARRSYRAAPPARRPATGFYASCATSARRVAPPKENRAALRAATVNSEPVFQ